jgi:glycosyltransferase involved in cell wall biosynthesis
MTAELVSIILPTYNRRILLRDAVASIQAQTWHQWELIIVDDGSTDGTGDDLPADDRIRFVPRPHTGNLAALRNEGLALAGGTAIAFQDSDDRWHADKLALQVARLAARPYCGWCYGEFRLIDADHREIPQRSGFDWCPREGHLLREMITTEASVALFTVLVRRELAFTLRFDESIPWGDDYEFLLRLALASPACVVDTVVGYAREHPGRGTHHRYDQMLNFALAYHRFGRQLAEPDLRRLSRQRAYVSLRDYLANARAAGALGPGLRNAVLAWWRG